MSEKIHSEHLQRMAYVYVRQSSNHQVREHRESRARQYGLAQRARELGFQRVTVIDQDLGRSGTGLQDRPGFAQLLTVVCEGLAGAVFALEASRLARNNRDWHHLIDLCAITETLLIDGDGIYDPRLLNDRLLLGLKGSLAEFELGLLRQRAREALEQKIRRGHLVWEPPVGFVRTEDDKVEKSPDRQVQEAIAGMFRKFRELGSARQTTLWYCTERILLPEAVPGTAGREIHWRLPGRLRIAQILKNPLYAGAFVYGRTRMNTVVQEGRAKQSGRRKRSQDEWKVLIHDHHPGYINWDEFQENQRILESNRNMKGGPVQGAVKRGAALLVGLLRCGRCGRKMFTLYGGVGGTVPRYVCRGDHRDQSVPVCLQVGGLRVDQAVARAVLEAIEPAGIEAALKAMDQLEQQGDEQCRSLNMALEKARYEAQRARRQYDAVDPENRLVAGELEARWNQSLANVEELEARLVEIDSKRVGLSDQDRQRLLDLGADLPKTWNHAAAPVELKKRILRTVLEEIIIDSQDEPPRHVLHLHWKGGIHTTLHVQRYARGQHSHGTASQVIELIQELSKVCDDRAIAAVLNRLGYRTGCGNSWLAARVAQARYHYQLPNFEKRKDWLTMQQAAAELKVSATVVQRLIEEKTLPARQVVKYAPWIIKREDLALPAVQTAVEAVHRGIRCPSTVPGQHEFAFK